MGRSAGGRAGGRGSGLVAAAALVFGYLVGACASAEPDAANPPGGERTTITSSEGSDQAVVEAYVAAMADGDIAGAQRYLCRDISLDADGQEHVADQLHRLVAQNGPLAFSRSEVESDPPAFDRLDELADPAVIRVWVSYGGDERPEPLLLFVTTDGGQRRICGHAQPRTPELVDATDGVLQSLGATTRTVDELVAIPAPEGFTEADAPDLPTFDDGSPQPIEGAARILADPSGYGGVTVNALRFDSAAAALTFAENRVREVMGDGVAVSILTEPAGAFAVEYVAFNTTLVEPADTWPVATRTMLVYGDLVVAVQQAPLGPDGPDDIWLSAVAAVDRIARSAPA